MTRKYGLRPDMDKSGKRFMSWWSPIKYMPESWLPRVVDLTDSFPPVLDQGEFGACTGNATIAAMRYNRINHDQMDIALSRLFPYNLARQAEGHLNFDDGAQPGNVLAALQKYGVPPESYFPYDSDHLLAYPGPLAFNAANAHKVTDAQRVDISARAVKTALYTYRPVIIGVEIFESFEGGAVAANGFVPEPAAGERSMGWHEMLIGGYGQRPGFFKVRNSWNGKWGDAGNCYLSEQYVEKHASDLYVINSESDY